MKNKIIILALLLLCYPSFSQWSTLHGYLYYAGPDEVFNGALDFDISPDNSIYVSSGYVYDNSPHYYWSRIAKSMDQGSSWTQLSYMNYTSSFSIRCMGTSELIVSRTDQITSQLSATSDDCASWIWFGSGMTDGYFSDFAFSDLSRGLALTYYANPNICIAEGGNFYCTVVDSLDFWFGRIQLINDTTAYILCRDTIGNVFMTGYKNNTLLKTTDFGTSWTVVYKDTAYRLNHFYFSNLNDGIMVGDSGLIWQTINGGYSWNPMESGTNKNIKYITSKNGMYFCVGSSGLILSKEAGQDSWNDISFGISDYYKIRLDNNLTGYLLSSDHQILKSEHVLGFKDGDDASSIAFYPNPCKDKLHYSCPELMQLKSISIRNSVGQELIFVQKDFNGQLDVSDLKPGMYLICFKLDKKVLTRKLIKN
ncbi:MAG: T9SS type A sorting domain-containing protein [Bacteroidetes bacterium]|nr:T9SS type A sorting domain-containing protein [Bacteroidota bacterium]